VLVEPLEPSPARARSRCRKVEAMALSVPLG
jgi:hypothetical protein